MTQKSLVILGAGPAGYSAAFLAAERGLKVTLVDPRATLGGVCLNEGCIPSKTLLHAAKLLKAQKYAADYGIQYNKPKINLDALRQRVNDVMGQLTGGLDGIANRRKVEVVCAAASFIDDKTLQITGEGIDEQWQFEQVLITTGSSAISLPNWPQDERIWSANEALEIREIPKQMAIVGGGIIGLEMATVYSALGSEITIVEMADQIAPGCDQKAARTLAKKLKAEGCTIHTKTQVSAVSASKKHLTLSCDGQFEGDIKADVILQSIGRRPATAGLGLEQAGVTLTERGAIQTDPFGATKIPNIFAAGDVVGGAMLAHRASHQAKAVIETLCGHPEPWSDHMVPSVAYTHPEVAWVGLNESDAKAAGIKAKSTSFPWAANGRSIAQNAQDGFCQLIYDTESGRILGATLMGEEAGELIAEVSVAIEMGANLEDIAHTVHAHPTRSESVTMAAQLALGICTDF